MSSSRQSAAHQPLGALEYELTDELAFQAGLALFNFQARNVKDRLVRQGALHPALPLVLASAMLVIALVVSVIWARDFIATPLLFALSCLVQVLLLFKLALYFWPAFARWYIRRGALRMARRLSPRTIRWTFFDDRLETRSASSERRLAWTDLQRVDVLPELWCLHWKPRVQLFVPAAALSAQLETFIRGKAGESGASIVDGG